MFDSLSEKLQGALSGVRQRGALTEEDISRAMREIRLGQGAALAHAGEGALELLGEGVEHRP